MAGIAEPKHEDKLKKLGILQLEIVKWFNQDSGFEFLPRRRTVERTGARSGDVAD